MASLGKRDELAVHQTANNKQLVKAIEQILEEKEIFGIRYCLVKWKDIPAFFSSWEPLESLRSESKHHSALKKKRLLTDSPASKSRSKKIDSSHDIESSPLLLFHTSKKSSVAKHDKLSVEKKREHSGVKRPLSTVCDDSIITIDLGARLTCDKIEYNVYEFYNNLQKPQPATATFDKPLHLTDIIFDNLLPDCPKTPLKSSLALSQKISRATLTTPKKACMTKRSPNILTNLNWVRILYWLVRTIKKMIGYPIIQSMLKHLRHPALRFLWNLWANIQVKCWAWD